MGFGGQIVGTMVILLLLEAVMCEISSCYSTWKKMVLLRTRSRKLSSGLGDKRRL